MIAELKGTTNLETIKGISFPLSLTVFVAINSLVVVRDH